MKDRIVVVTGAGSGVGAAVARLLASQDARLVLVGRRLEALQDTRRSLGQGEEHCTTVVGDVADERTAARVTNAAIEAFGRIDGLVNAAAVSSKTPLEDLSIDEIDHVYAINARAPVVMTRDCLRALRASDAGAVVNVSSALSLIPKLDQLAYGMSKAALEYATRSLAHGLAQDGIRVNAVAPGPLLTPLHDGLFEDLETAYTRMAATTLVGRLGTADEVAQWIVELLSPTAAWVTGAIIRIDGGRTVWPPGAS